MTDEEIKALAAEVASEAERLHPSSGGRIIAVDLAGREDAASAHRYHSAAFIRAICLALRDFSARTKADVAVYTDDGRESFTWEHVLEHAH